MAEHRQESELERVADRVEIVSGSSTSTSSSESFTLQLVSKNGSEFILINGHNSRAIAPKIINPITITGASNG